MDGTTLCGGMTMKGEKCMISSTKMESDERNDSGSWMSRTTLGHEFKALNDKNDFGSQMRRTTLGRELMALNAKNDFGS